MDTAAKRFSALSLSLPFRGIQTPPDGAMSVGDRLALAYYYSGVTPTTVPAGFIRIQSASIRIPQATASIRIPDATATLQA